MRDPYDVLGVARDADADTIRKRFKKLARKYHPDVNKDPGAEERFKEISSAHDIVGDEERRKLYDEFGEVSTKPGFKPEQARAWSRAGGGRPQGFRGGFPGFDFGFDAGGDVDMDDILGSIFGGRAGGRARRGAGRDQHAKLVIDPMMVIRGGETTIRVQRPDGTSDTLTVRVPAGAKDGGKLRLRGQGLPPPMGGPCGDLVITLQVPEHPFLRRTEDDLEMDVPITVLEAIRGGSITVPTPTGDVKVSVPPGSTSGRRLRLKGKGVQRRANPGDLYLVLRPTVPEEVDDSLIAAAEAIESAYPADVRAELKL